jgi:hypothetical protein
MQPSRHKTAVVPEAAILCTYSQTQQCLLTVETVLGPRQCDRDGVRIRAPGVLGYAENNLNDLGVDVDSLHERPDNLSSAVPVSARQLWSNGSR